MQPTKLPPRRVVCDDFVITVDGVEYRPHAGQYVEFRGQSTIREYLRTLRLLELHGMAGADLMARPSGEVQGLVSELRAITAENIAGLAGAIISWDWTDEAGNAYPSPPSAEDLSGLCVQEIGFLSLAYKGQAGATEEARKNGSPPSISRSTRRKAARSRKSG